MEQVQGIMSFFGHGVGDEDGCGRQEKDVKRVLQAWGKLE